MTHCEAGGDVTDVLERIAATHEWPNGDPATNFAEKFHQNGRLFRHAHIFLIRLDDVNADKVTELLAGRFKVEIGPFESIPARQREAMQHHFENVFVLPEALRTRCAEIARMTVWAGGGDLEYPPLPTIEGVGTVRYEAVCDFNARPPYLWPPEDLREYLRARYLNVSTCDMHTCLNVVTHTCSLTHVYVPVQVTNKHSTYVTIDDSSGEVLDGLVDLVQGVLDMPEGVRPKPLSLTDAEAYGHVDPVMWTAAADEPVLNLKDNIAEILSMVKNLKITDDTILDRFQVRNEDRRRGMKLFVNGHCDPDTYTLSRGTHSVTGRAIVIASMSVVASMRPKTYLATCVYDAATGVQLPAPDSKCECVAQVRECLSHFVLCSLTHMCVCLCAAY